MANLLLVTLVHNRKNLVGLAINSALNQTLPKGKFKHLLFDNGSTDGADRICEAFSKRHSHIIYFKNNENLGQQGAYNKILNEIIPKKIPEAQVMCILDSDDEIYPETMEEINRMYDKHPEVGATYSGFDIIDINGRLKVRNHGKAKLVPNQHTHQGQLILKKLFLSSNPCGHIRCYSIKALREIGGFNTEYKYATDYNIFGHIMERYPVYKIDRVLYRFRQHGNQIEGQHSPQQTADWQSLQKYFKQRWTKMGII